MQLKELNTEADFYTKEITTLRKEQKIIFQY